MPKSSPASTLAKAEKAFLDARRRRDEALAELSHDLGGKLIDQLGPDEAHSFVDMALTFVGKAPREERFDQLKKLFEPPKPTPVSKAGQAENGAAAS